jgi:hypothetical protein
MPRTKSFAKWVREALKINEKLSIRDLYKGYKEICENDTPPRIPARYTSCRIIIHVLRKCGVVRNVDKSELEKNEEEPMYKWTMHDRKYIALVKGKDEHPVWDDPWGYLKAEREKAKLGEKK